MISAKSQLSWLTELRLQAFKLKPIQMSSTLLQQLNGIASNLKEQAEIIQKLVKAKKNKHKYYETPVSEDRWAGIGISLRPPPPPPPPQKTNKERVNPKAYIPSLPLEITILKPEQIIPRWRS